MKAYVILRAENTDYSTQYGYSNVVCIKYRKSQADKKAKELKAEDGEEYYYEEIFINLGDIPTIANGQYTTLLDIDAYNSTIQLEEDVVAARNQEIEELKSEVKKLKQSVAYEKTRTNRAESVRAKTEQELRTVRNTIRAAKKLDKPKLLGFEDNKGQMYHIDPDKKNAIFFDYMGSRLYKTIGEVRRIAGDLKPIYEEKSE